MISNEHLFEILCRHFNAAPDRRGEVNVTCPACGKEGSSKNVHFSFRLNPPAGSCFSCGYKNSLFGMAKELNILDPNAAPSPRVERPAPLPARVKTFQWMRDLDRLTDQYNRAPDLKTEWEKYKILQPETYQERRLGLGFFPQYSSQCTHLRLIVPILQRGKTIAFRGRKHSENCGCAKWLTTAMGNRAPILYNGAILLSPEKRNDVVLFDLGDTVPGAPWIRGETLFILENPVDAFMFGERGLNAVATLGVTIWNRSRPWTQVLKGAKPARVVVLYDHDIAGNGAASESEWNQMRLEWKDKNVRNGADREPPIPNGIRLVNELQQAGINATLYKWPVGTPLKFDPGNILETWSVAHG